MNGAREFAELFPTGQYGRLYLVSGSHARGKTFHIYVLPADVTAIPNGSQNRCLNKDAVEVYGITGGQPGWTESYGWLYGGKWQSDFAALVADKKAEIVKLEEARAAARQLKIQQEEQRKLSLLATYAEVVEPLL